MSKQKQRGVVIPEQARFAVARQVKGDDGKPAPGVQGVILRAIGVQRPLVLAYVRRLRSRHPEASAAQLAALVERDYLRTVTGTGAAGGATAVVPGIGTVASLGVSVGVTAAFLEASALYAQAVAELHGIAVKDPEASKALVMAVMLGDEASGLLAGVSEQIAVGGKSAWGAAFASATGKGGALSAVGKELQSRFLRHFAASQTASAVGRALPFGIGAAVGGVSSRVLGRKVVRSTREAFGELSTLNAQELDATLGALEGARSARAPRALGRGRTRRGAHEPTTADVSDPEKAASDVEQAIEAERARRAQA